MVDKTKGNRDYNYEYPYDSEPKINLSEVEKEMDEEDLFLGLRRTTLCHVLASIVSLCFILPPMVMLLDRRDPIILTHGEINPPTVENGMKATVKWYFKEYREHCDGEFTPLVRDSSKRMFYYARQPVVFPFTTSESKEFFTKQFTLPSEMAAGEAMYAVVADRWCNPLQRALWPIHSVSPWIAFTVLPDKDSKETGSTQK